MTTELQGTLEIDHERGVIYFHGGVTGQTIMRLCGLPTPVPKIDQEVLLDIVHKVCVNWPGKGSALTQSK